MCHTMTNVQMAKFFLQVGNFGHGSRINSMKSLENFPTGKKNLSHCVGGKHEMNYG